MSEVPHAAGVMLADPGGRLLFMRRKDDGTWAWPAGSIEGNETPEQAARRETQEETGLVTGDLTQIDEGAGFVTFRSDVDMEFVPAMNGEHSEYKWASMKDAPMPLHPGVRSTLKKYGAAYAPGAATMDKREYDKNGWFEAFDNPISKVGVYAYSEASIRKGGDRSKMVGVYRPAEELGSDECVNSFKLMPWTDDHPSDLLGDPERGFVSPDEKGVRGVIGEKVYFDGDTLYGNLKVFSPDLNRKIDAGKKELSCGYHCDFVPQEGVFEGKPYQYVQRNIRGNHTSSVKAGRMGSDVRVQDAAEVLAFAFDLKEEAMVACTECGKVHGKEQDCMDADTEKFVCDSFNSLVGELEKKGYSKEYATKVAGKVAAEKGKTGHDSTGDSTDGDFPMAAKDANVKDPVKEDDKPSDKASPGAGDSMSSEEEAGMDAKEEACDAEEEKKEKDDTSKEAKDRQRARDRRAGARDARKMARDAKSARDAKAAKDAESDKDKDDKKDKGMDAAEITLLVRKEIAAGGKALDADELVKLAVAKVGPAIRKEEAAKSSLYGRLSLLVGAFDHSEMSHEQMASYGLERLNAPKAADPVTALDFYLAGRSRVVVEAARPRGFAQDAGEGSFLTPYLNS